MKIQMEREMSNSENGGKTKPSGIYFSERKNCPLNKQTPRLTPPFAVE